MKTGAVRFADGHPRGLLEGDIADDADRVGEIAWCDAGVTIVYVVCVEVRGLQPSGNREWKLRLIACTFEEKRKLWKGNEQKSVR